MGAFEQSDRVGAPVGQAAGDGVLERSGEIGDICRAHWFDACHFVPDGGLEAGKREITPGSANHGPWQGEARLVSLHGGFFQSRAAGITETEEFRRLVEGFAHGIVNGRAKALVLTNPLDRQQLAVAAGH